MNVEVKQFIFHAEHRNTLFTLAVNGRWPRTAAAGATVNDAVKHTKTPRCSTCAAMRHAEAPYGIPRWRTPFVCRPLAAGSAVPFPAAAPGSRFGWHALCCFLDRAR
ncbi:hypothetical protein NPIL_107551 [Nephila pilipes]|uniref:Uncharacterized protein n=1 Tax=Nephila pilipes TaxID=299642 RepID=A0A8X6N8R6_NEPPI|nr:hypothetical protein NPIL_107551 [Nephila pilipes]